MLDHLRQRVIEALASVRLVTVATYGPAELQASQVPCEALGMCLYLLLPLTSDHLVNLENRPEAVVTTPEWQLRGRAVVLARGEGPGELTLCHEPEAEWGRVVLVRPAQFNLRRPHGWGYSETIDIDE